MKSACVLLAGLDAVNSLRVAPSVIRMQAEAAVIEPPPPPPLPKIKTMMVGDKTLAGDMSFDPLMLADSPDKLAWFREAEIRHARLAMLAAIGWPVSELTNMGGLLTDDGRAPSLLNGGLGDVSSIYWAGVVGLAVLAEAKGLDKQFGKKDNYLPGQLGLDLLGMDSEFTRNAEITNGRVAMLAITIYAYEEALMQAPVFPINLFTPFKKVVEAVAAAPAVAPVEFVPEAVAPVLELAPVETLMEAAPVAPIAEMAESIVAPIAEAVAPIAEAIAPIADAVAPIVDAVSPM